MDRGGIFGIVEIAGGAPACRKAGIPIRVYWKKINDFRKDANNRV